MKSQKTRSQMTIVMERITLGRIKINNIIRRKRTSRVIPNLSLIKNRPLSAPTADRMVTWKLNASNPPRGRAQKVSQITRLVLKNVNLMT